jgi:hypothetical protein
MSLAKAIFAQCSGDGSAMKRNGQLSLILGCMSPDPFGGTGSGGGILRSSKNAFMHLVEVLSRVNLETSCFKTFNFCLSKIGTNHHRPNVWNCWVMQNPLEFGCDVAIHVIRAKPELLLLNAFTLMHLLNPCKSWSSYWSLVLGNFSIATFSEELALAQASGRRMYTLNPPCRRVSAI